MTDKVGLPGQVTEGRKHLPPEFFAQFSEPDPGEQSDLDPELLSLFESVLLSGDDTPLRQHGNEVMIQYKQWRRQQAAQQRR